MRRPFTSWQRSRYNPGIALFSGELHARRCLSSLVAFGSQRYLKSCRKTETSRCGPHGDAVVLQVASEEQSGGPALAFGQGQGAFSSPSSSGAPSYSSSAAPASVSSMDSQPHAPWSEGLCGNPADRESICPFLLQSDEWFCRVEHDSSLLTQAESIKQFFQYLLF